MKTCTKCGIPKELSEFYTNSKCRDGRDTRCKKCVSEIKKEFFQLNKSIIINRRRKLRQDNRTQ
jgi:hypothetical protein